MRASSREGSSCLKQPGLPEARPRAEREGSAIGPQTLHGSRCSESSGGSPHAHTRCSGNMRRSGKVLSTGRSCMVPAEVRAIKEKTAHLSSLTCEVGLTREDGSLAASLGVFQSPARLHPPKGTHWPECWAGSTHPSLRTSQGAPAPLAWALTALGHVLLLHLQARAGICRDSGSKMASTGPPGLPKVPAGSRCRAEAGGLGVGKGPPRGPWLPGGTHVLTGPLLGGLS